MAKKPADYEVTKEAHKVVNYMARHIIGRDMAPKDETCRLCTKATTTALYRAYAAGMQGRPFIRGESKDRKQEIMV